MIIAAHGFTWAYASELVALVLSFGGLLIRATPRPQEAHRPTFASIAAGFGYARGRPELIGMYAVDIVAMPFGIPMALFPLVAERFGGPAILGLLWAAPSVGSLLASGWFGRVHRHGIAVIVAATVWGVAIVGFGFADDQ